MTEATNSLIASPRAKNLRDDLKQVTTALLEGETPLALRNSAIRLYNIFSQITGVQDNSSDPADHQETILPSGKAISPRDAARCVLDFARTTTFLRGIYRAILEAQKRFPNQQLEILYAGTGPYATLAVPLTTKFGADEIQFTLLDVHERALHSAERIFATLGLQAYVRDYIQEDATRYRHNRPVHMIITETMQRGLEKEPQVAITMNLAPQLIENGIFIPQEILVDACLYDVSREFAMLPAGSDESAFRDVEKQRVRINLGRVVELTAVSACVPHDDYHLSPITIEVPDEVPPGFQLMLRSKVKVFAEHILDEYDSGITNPLLLENVWKNRAGNRLEFIYSLGPEPRIHCRWADGDQT